MLCLPLYFIFQLLFYIKTHPPPSPVKQPSTIKNSIPSLPKHPTKTRRPKMLSRGQLPELLRRVDWAFTCRWQQLSRQYLGWFGRVQLISRYGNQPSNKTWAKWIVDVWGWEFLFNFIGICWVICFQGGCLGFCAGFRSYDMSSLTTYKMWPQKDSLGAINTICICL